MMLRRPTSGCRPAALLLLLAVVVATLAAPGCDTRATPKAAAAGPEEVRIVSLSPAISRTLLDLGLGNCIVGRSAYCSFLDPSIPAVGDLLDVDYERLTRLDPTHVLVQAPRRGVDPRLASVAAGAGWRLETWTGLDTIDDIEALVRDLAALFAETPATPTIDARSATLLNEMAAALAPRDASRWRGSVLLVTQVEPPSVFGRRTYLHEVLVRLGGVNACRAEGWATLSLEDVTRLDPEAIIIIKPGVDGTIDPRELAGPLARLDVAAVRDGRIALLTHPDTLLPSSGLVGVADSLRAVLRAFGGEPGS